MSGFLRSYTLDDIAIRAGGDGRTVVAYAAMFNAPYEVTDGEGHYEEVITPSAFDRSLAGGIGRFQVLYNHGRAPLSGMNISEYGLPLGTPLEIRADGRGLLTVTRYAKTPLAEQVLELIREGAIRGMSFSGRWVNQRRIPAFRADGLPRIERTEVALREYGPTPFPVNSAAAVVGVRSLLDEVRQLPDAERVVLASLLSAGTSAEPAPQGTSAGSPPAAIDTPAQPAAPAAPVVSGPSLDQLINEQRRRR